MVAARRSRWVVGTRVAMEGPGVVVRRGIAGENSWIGGGAATTARIRPTHVTAIRNVPIMTVIVRIRM